MNYELSKFIEDHRDDDEHLYDLKKSVDDIINMTGIWKKRK